MRTATLIVFIVILALAGAWVYRTFLRPIDPLAPEVLALAKHFDENGLAVRPYSVRHGFRHSEVLAVAAFEIRGFPLPVSITLCPTGEAAAAHLLSAEGSPNLMHPKRNGRLVMDLPMWGDDTDEMATKVVNAFSTFNDGT